MAWLNFMLAAKKANDMRTERYIGIDYLRAFFSVCVVLAHLGYISPSLIFNRELYLAHIFTVSDFINFYVILLSVPVFFIISNYFFFRNQKTNPCYALILSASEK
jgi:peptidoglycan/LPS O-acetylase OafA/YrhL